MVPDVAYNEAYISFVFTHPEWRRAGIGSFLLYHLIQVTNFMLFIHNSTYVKQGLAWCLLYELLE